MSCSRGLHLRWLRQDIFGLSVLLFLPKLAYVWKLDWHTVILLFTDFRPFCYCCPSFFSVPPINSRNSNPGSRRAGSSGPSPPRFVPCIFIARRLSPLSSLADSRRIAPTHARRSQQVIIFSFFAKKNSKSHHGGIRTPGPTLLAVLEGNH